MLQVTVNPMRLCRFLLQGWWRQILSFMVIVIETNLFFNAILVFFCDTGIWTRDLHLEPLHQSFFCEGFFWDKVSWTISLGWLWTKILPISASWVVRITAWATGSRLLLAFGDRSLYAAQAGLKFMILPHYPPKCGHYKCAPSHPV
jgi:hypothetical protein